LFGKSGREGKLPTIAPAIQALRGRKGEKSNFNVAVWLGRAKSKPAATTVATGLCRGNKIPIELFCHAVKGWGKDTKRLVMAA
jgi:hypothetical protein